MNKSLERSRQRSTAPYLSTRMKVTQSSVYTLVGMCLFGALGLIPAIVAPLLVDSEAGGWRGALAALGILVGGVVGMAGMIVGTIAWFFVEARWEAWRGIKKLDGWTRVTMDEKGLQVDGLGLSPWREVGFEFIPDCTTALCVKTKRYGRLLLQDDPDRLAEALVYHLKQQGS